MAANRRLLDPSQRAPSPSVPSQRGRPRPNQLRTNSGFSETRPMAVNVVKVYLLGCSFSVQTDETREYLETLLGELDRRIQSIRASTRVEDPLRLSILGNIMLLDELVRNRGHSGDADEVSRIAERLIARIDDSLGGGG